MTSPGPVQTKWEVQRQLISGPSSLNDIQYCNELRETHSTRHDVNSGLADAGDDGKWSGDLVSSISYYVSRRDFSIFRAFGSKNANFGPKIGPFGPLNRSK